MIKTLIRRLLGKVVKDRLVREAIAVTADEAVTAIADKHTGGLASDVAGVVKRQKARRRAKADRDPRAD